MNQIAAIVNDQVITEDTLNQLVSVLLETPNTDGTKLSPAAARKSALDQLVARDLQLQVAKMASITASNEEINNAMTHIAEEHQITLAQLPQALAQQGLSFNQFKQQITDQIIIQKFQQQQLAGTINIKPKEIDALVKKLAKQPRTIPQKQQLYHFIEILIPVAPNPSEQQLIEAKQKFDVIAKMISQNVEFDTISQKVLNTPANDLGWRSTNQLPEGFVKIAQQMKPGQVAPPARAENGIHIIKLVANKTLNQTNTLNAAENDITETHVRHILLKKDRLTPSSTLERRLLSIRADLMHGGNFSQLAEENSEDPGSVAQGGDLGWVKPETLDAKFEAAMNQLKINEISMPIESQFGWHLIQVLERKKIQDPQTALRVKAQQILFEQKMQIAVSQLISQLKAQAYIKYFSTTGLNTNNEKK